MKWSSIFTIPDSSIVQEGSVDPLGMQVIWTHFGQKIFQNKLTTVATDIRNYSINLLQHYVLYRIQTEHSETFELAKQRFLKYTNDYDLKSGMLILMEDAMIFSLMLNQDDENVDTLGLLGSYKAEIELKKDPNEVLIEAEKTKGILVRQLQLGVTGRYKGPFINMGFLTRNLQYSESWGDVRELINQWPEGKLLADDLLDLICELIVTKTGDYPVLTLAELQNNAKVIEHYVRCFGKLNISDVFKKFWEKQIGLESGAAKALYEQVGNNDNKTHHGILIQRARENQEGEAAYQLDQIIRLEPFLANISQLFYLMTDIANKKLSELEEDIRLLSERIDLNELKDLESESPRLRVLVKYVEEANGHPMRIAEKVLSYHAWVMQNRGGGAWVEIQDDQLKHYIAQRAPIKTEDFIRTNYWYHDYYLGSIRSVYNGLHPN